jgi:hypothetical protein
VTVIGASRGRIVPVNGRADTAQVLPAVRRLLDVEAAADVTVIAVRAVGVLPALEQCMAKDIAGTVVISAGFRSVRAAPRGSSRGPGDRDQPLDGRTRQRAGGGRPAWLSE